MSDSKQTGVALGLGVSAAALSALALSKQAKAAPIGNGNGQLVIPDEVTMQALISIVENTERIDDNTLRFLQSMEKLAASLGVSGVMENPEEITAFRVYPPGVLQAVNLPDREVPFDMEFVIKALQTNAGIVYVGNSAADAINVNSSFPLIANEAVGYKIKNSNQLWISVSRAGEGAVCTVEQRRK